MSAECSTCGTDLVYGADYPDMYCLPCRYRQERDAANTALEREQEECNALKAALEEIDDTALAAGGGGPIGGVFYAIHVRARQALD